MRSKWFPGINAKRDKARRDRKARYLAAMTAKPIKDPVCYSCKGDIPRSATPEESWMSCCSEACLRAWSAELDRRDEVRAAGRLGMPVAEYRKR